MSHTQTIKITKCEKFLLKKAEAQEDEDLEMEWKWEKVSQREDAKEGMSLVRGKRGENHQGENRSEVK